MPQLDKKDWKNLKIPENVKNRMDVLKGNQTYGEFLDNMLGYLEVTGVNPKYNQLPPAATIIKALKEELAPIYRRVENSIQIIRNVETHKLDVMLHGIEDLLQGKGNSYGAAMTDEEAIKLISINERQADELDNLRKNCCELKNSSTIQSAKVNDIIDTLSELLSDKALGGVDANNNLIITREYRTQLLEKIKTIAYDNHNS